MNPIQNLTAWDGTAAPLSRDELRTSPDYTALPPADRVAALNQIQRNWANWLREKAPEYGGSYGDIIRDVERDFAAARTDEVENGLAQDLAAGTFTDAQVADYQMGRISLEGYPEQQDRGGPWVTHKLPVSQGFVYIRHAPDLTEDNINRNIRMGAAFGGNEAGKQYPMAAYAGPEGSDRAEVSWQFNGADGKPIKGTEDVAVGKFFADVRTGAEHYAPLYGQNPSEKEAAMLAALPAALRPAMAASESWFAAARQRPEIADKVGQGFWSGLPGEAAKGFLNLGAAATYGPRALTGDQTAVREWEQGQADIGADIEGQSRLAFRGALSDKVLQGISGEALPLALSSGAGALASAARKALTSATARTFLSRMAALEMEQAAKQGLAGMTREGAAKLIAGELTGEGAGATMRQGLATSLARGYLGKWLGTAEIEGPLARQLADRVSNAVAFLPSAARAGLDNMATTLNEAERLRSEGREEEAKALEDRAVLNGWAGVGIETLTENMWLNEMMVTRSGRPLSSVANAVLERTLQPGRMAALRNRAVTFLTRALKEGNKEGMEEVVAGISGREWMNTFADQNQDLLADLPQEYLTGAALGAMLSGAKAMAENGQPAALRELVTRGLDGDAEALASLARIRGKAEALQTGRTMQAAAAAATTNQPGDGAPLPNSLNTSSGPAPSGSGAAPGNVSPDAPAAQAPPGLLDALLPQPPAPQISPEGTSPAPLPANANRTTAQAAPAPAMAGEDPGKALSPDGAVAVPDPTASANNETNKTGTVPPAVNYPDPMVAAAPAAPGNTPAAVGTAAAPPVPDALATVTEQARLAADPASSRAAVLITPGTPRPPKVKGLVAFQGDSPHGLVLYNPKKITPAQVRKAAQGAVFDASILGQTGQTPAAGTAAVTASLPGVPAISAELVPDNDPAATAAAVQAARAAAPGASVTVQPAADVTAARARAAEPVANPSGLAKNTGRARPVEESAPAGRTGNAGDSAASSDPPKRPATGGRRLVWRDENARGFGANPLVRFIRERGGMMSMRQAIARARRRAGADPAARENAERAVRATYEDIPEVLRNATHYREMLFTKDEGADDAASMATQAFQNGLLPDAQPSTMAAELEKLLQSHQRAKTQDKTLEDYETARAMAEDAASRGIPAKDMPAQLGKDRKFDKATAKQTGKTKPLPVEDLTVGSTLRVKGEKFRVDKIERNEDGDIDRVRLNDGATYGVVWVSPGEVHFVEDLRIKRFKPSGEFLTDEDLADLANESPAPVGGIVSAGQRDMFAGAADEPFNLTAESAEERKAREAAELAAENALRAKEAEAAKAAADRAQGRLFDSLAQEDGQTYTVSRGADPNHPDQPGLAAAIVRAGSAVYQQGYLFGDAAPGSGGAASGRAAAARPAQRAGRGLTPAEARYDAATRFQRLAEGRGADFGPTGTISSVMAELITGEIPAFDIRGQRIETPGDFAMLLQPLRSPLFESVKVAIMDGNTVVHSEVIHVGSVDQSVLSPSRIVQVLGTAAKVSGRPVKKLRVLYSHNHPSGNPDPSRADRQMHQRVIAAVEAAGSTVWDHVITDGTKFYSFEQFGIFDLANPQLAAWEATPAIDRPKILDDTALKGVVDLLRQGGEQRGHIILLDSRGGIIAVEVMPETTKPAITAKAVQAVARVGAAKLALDLGHLPTPEVRGMMRHLIDTAEQIGFQLMDISTRAIDSFRAMGLMEGDREVRGLDGFLREEETAYTAAPAVPDGWDVNRFGLRVQADERIRQTWRDAFQPKLYETFGFDELVKRVNAWIGQQGGMEGAAALFMDDASGLSDYERNALGIVLAKGLDTRTNRAIAAGNGTMAAESEAAFDAVIDRLEQLGTQAGQALAAFRLWGGVSPRGTVRAIERQTARKRQAQMGQDLPGENPENLRQEVEREAKKEKEEAESDTRRVTTNWIQRLATSQSDTLSWRKPGILSALEKLIRAHMREVNPRFAAEAEALGVDAHNAGVLDRLILEEHRRRAGIAREKAADALIRRLTAKAPTKRARAAVPRFVKALFDAAQNGALSRADFLDAYAQAFGLPRFTAEFAAGIRQQVERVQAAPESSWLRQKEQNALMGMLARWEGLKSREIFTAFWYANILSGLGTHIVNITGNASHLLLRTVQMLFTRPRQILDFLRGMLAGAAEGVRQGWAAFTRGEPVMRGDEEWQKMDVLELLWTTDNADLTWGKLIAKYGAASWGRYVFRALTAADSFFWNTAKEGRAWVDMARSLAAGQTVKQAAGLDAVTWADAQQQAHADLTRMGERTTPLDVDRRAFEIVESRRDAEVTHTARAWGARATYNYEPEGTMGAFAQAVESITQKIPLFRALVPFKRIVANIADVNMDWTPIGLLRAAKGGHLFNSQGKRFSPQDRLERVVSGAVGTAALFALYAVARSYKDDDDARVPFMIYGMGPKDASRRAQMPGGWKPFSVKMGNQYVSLEGTPLAFVLAMIGTTLDTERYGNRRDRSDVMARGFALTMSAPSTLLNSGFLSSLNQTFQMLTGDRKPGAWAARMTASMIPASSFLRDVAVAIDPVQTDNGRFWATLAGNIPVLRGEAAPLLNEFGDQVKAPGPWLVQRIVRTRDTSDPEATWLAEHKLHISGMDNDVAVGQWLEKSDKPRSVGGLLPDRAFRAEILDRLSNGYLTPDERTQFLRSTGPQIRKAIRILSQRRGPAVTQGDVDKAVSRIRRAGMKALIK